MEGDSSLQELRLCHVWLSDSGSGKLCKDDGKEGPRTIRLLFTDRLSPGHIVDPGFRALIFNTEYSGEMTPDYR